MWRCTVHTRLGRSAEAHRNPGSGTLEAPMSLISALRHPVTVRVGGGGHRVPFCPREPWFTGSVLPVPLTSPRQKATRHHRLSSPSFPRTIILASTDVRADFAPEGAPTRFSPVLSDPSVRRRSCSTNDYEFVMRT